MIPAERRIAGVQALIDKGAYFVVHAPRQTGKTTAMKALARRLTAEGRYAALRFSCQNAGVFPEDVGAAEEAVWGALIAAASAELPESLQPPERVDEKPGNFLQTQLTRWAKACPRPLVLVFDEIDAIGGSSVKSILSQLRSGFDGRPAPFPWSVILCGMRDVRDYKAASGGDPTRLGSSSPFNIKEESLLIRNFTEAEMRELYGQHTAETGQVFTEDALLRAWALSQGQPWLTNALAREVVEKLSVPLAEPVTAAHLDEAKERLILARATHLDSLLARLREDRVRRVLEPILAGELPNDDPYDDDYAYTRDLGLITPRPEVRIANPIYREIILRVLAQTAETAVFTDRRRYLRGDGTLDFGALLQGFAEFWTEHGEILAGRMAYPEVAPQLVLMAYLHRIVNGGGFIDREVGLGTKRIDLLIRWPRTSSSDAGGKPAVQREAIELKVWRDRDKKGDPLPAGLVQLDEYLASLGLSEGVLVIFDARAKAAPIEERTRFEEAMTRAGRKVTVLRA
ncbi:MAG: ATP-binding protein [Byssovorax sp.]